eukprot:1949971-Rhodomonas_salina.2
MTISLLYVDHTPRKGEQVNKREFIECVMRDFNISPMCEDALKVPTHEALITLRAENAPQSADFMTQLARSQFARLLAGFTAPGAMQHKLSAHVTVLTEFNQRMESRVGRNHPIAMDAKGQVQIALSTQEYRRKWGMHYLRSLWFATNHEYRNNFKDASLKLYGCALFDEILDDITDVFAAIPPPRPSRDMRLAAGVDVLRCSGPQFAHVFNNEEAACFHPSTLVLLEGGVARACCDIWKGDRVQCDFATPPRTATVVCVTRLKCSGIARCCQIARNLILTAWHPVYAIEGTSWMFTKHTGAPCEDFICTALFNYVLSEGGNSICAEGMRCITMGHNITNDPIAAHDFFGTEAVVAALKAKDPIAFENGLVELLPRDFTRSPATGRIHGFTA